MTIQPIFGEPGRIREARRNQEGNEVGGKVTPPAPVAPKEEADRVEISREGRAQVEQAALSGTPGRLLDDSRLEAIRLRIQEGAYDTPESAEEVARRILEAGDLGF
ncbi:MAG: hypothetical protein EA421_01415 [Gemmatimonadales bacterium]|jgi:anti-sigma28 factor (negative regulator of flagellin synthesis)|nr:MAG: hypothetical protein EA421_01415 [Gemmatimonadales bacterium]